MNKVLKNIFLTIVITSIPLVCAGMTQEISVGEILNLAEKNSYSLTAAQYQELAAKKGIIIAKAGYFPILNFEAIDTVGFPGSSGWIGIEGLMGSPYRKDFSGGLVAKQIIYDFGRTKYDVKKSKYEVEYAKQNTKVTAYEVKLLALATYYECSQYRTLEAIWGELAKEAAIITKEVKHFVSTGQRSIVDTYLSEIQLEDSRTGQAYFAAKYKGAKHELSIITGIEENSFSCLMLDDKNQQGITDPDLYSSPFLARAQADMKIAEASLNREKADLWPKIITVGSVGTLDHTHLLPRKNYSLGLGVIMPIYDLHVVGGIKRAKEVLNEKNEEVAAQIQFLEEMNAKYDTVIDASTVKLKHVSHELSLAKEGFKVAKRRYFDLEGELIDLREALRDLSRISVELEDSRANILRAQGSKDLLNGG